MSYRLKTGDDAVTDGVRRVAKSQIDAALAEIDDEGIDRTETVHQVRKRCKKLRGLLRLVRPAFPAYADENAAFRDAARLLSGVRDAAVMVETYDALAARFGRDFDAARFQPVRDHLVERKRAVEGEGELVDARLALFRETMEEARKRAKAWTLEAEGAAALAGGYEKTFKRGAKALKAARAEPAAENLHELRKRAKYHWYHVRLLREVWPAVTAALDDELDRLGDLLGDEHDLAVFEEEIGRLSRAGVERDVLKDLAALARRRREELQTAALALAARAFSGKAGAAAKRMGALWEAWQARPDTRDPAEAAAAAADGGGDGDGASGSNREIERKFVVTGEDWRPAVASTRHIRQGYLLSDDRMSLRVRIVDEESATMTVKSADADLSRTEIEFPLPLAQARALMAFAVGEVIDKRRHVVPVGGVAVEVDEFAHPEAGLVIAEVELSGPDDPVPEAPWIGPEVTGDRDFYGATLATGR